MSSGFGSGCYAGGEVGDSNIFPASASFSGVFDLALNGVYDLELL